MGAQARPLPAVDLPKVKAIQSELRSMIGMDAVAEQVDSLVSNAVIQRKRAEKGLPIEARTMHLVFSGPSGTGKSTVAAELGQLYKALGLLPKGHVVTAKKTDLIGSVLGETQKKTQATFDKARGGVLFIDEAYALHGGEHDLYGQQAIDTLVELMDAHRDDTVVIMAGYPKEMKTLLGTNSGLKSRMPTTINFPAYSDGDLRKILSRFMAKGKYRGAPGAKAALDEAVKETGKGNARNVRNLYEKILSEQEKRLAYDVGQGTEPKAGDLRRIYPEDVYRGVMAHREAELSVPEEKKQRRRAKGTLVPS